MSTQTKTIRRFYLVRSEDVSGVSGTGKVAEGVEFTNGKCVITWLTPTSSVAVYDNVKCLLIIHGHDNRTNVEYIDE
jgi:hypothetical protein